MIDLSNLKMSFKGFTPVVDVAKRAFKRGVELKGLHEEKGGNGSVFWE